MTSSSQQRRPQQQKLSLFGLIRGQVDWPFSKLSTGDVHDKRACALGAPTNIWSDTSVWCLPISGFHLFCFIRTIRTTLPRKFPIPKRPHDPVLLQVKSFYKTCWQSFEGGLSPFHGNHSSRQEQRAGSLMGQDRS